MKQGFTLLELLIVMAMLALLTVYIVPLLLPITEEAKLTQDVRSIAQTLYELQAKSQSGFKEKGHNTPITEKITLTEQSTSTLLPFHSFGLLLSTNKTVGVRPLEASITKENTTYTISEETEGKNILSPRDQENAPSSFLSELLKDGTPQKELKLYFIPFSNTVLTVSEGAIEAEEKSIQFTTANSRYPRLTRTNLLHTSTLLLSSPPSL